MDVAVILAAGSSTRIGGGIKKEYLSYQGEPLLYHGVKTFCDTAIFGKIIIVCREDMRGETEEMLSRLQGLEFIPGGSTRQESVLKALSHLEATAPETVLIHDGARPFVSGETILAVLGRTRDLGACIPVEPSTNTMKLIDEEGRIVSHLHREFTRGAQTPQGFRFLPLLNAHRRAAQSAGSRVYTDDSELWDAFVSPVFTVEGNRENLKITYPADLLALGISPGGPPE